MGRNKEKLSPVEFFFSALQGKIIIRNLKTYTSTLNNRIKVLEKSCDVHFTVLCQINQIITTFKFSKQ